MKLLLDTNVLIAGFIARGVCHELIEYVAANHEVVCSEYVLAEFREKLVEKFDITAADARRAAALLRERFHIVIPQEVPKDACPDADDLPVLGTALAGNCICLVTGDGDLLALGEFKGIEILSPSEFWSREDELAG